MIKPLIQFFSSKGTEAKALIARLSTGVSLFKAFSARYFVPPSCVSRPP